MMILKNGIHTQQGADFGLTAFLEHLLWKPS